MQDKSFYQRYWKDLPGFSKGIIAVAVVGGVGIAIWSIVKAEQRKKEIKDANKAAEDASKELVTLHDQGINPSYGDSQYQVFSESLVEAMNGCGTDEDAIYEVFKQIKNGADIRKLIAAFGVRFYRPCAADQPISYTRWLFNDQAFGGSLSTFLTYDLSGSEIGNINDILKKNKVNYTF